MDKSHKKKVEKTYSTDDCMKKLASSLVEDFRTEMGPEYKQEWVNCLNDIPRLRSIQFPGRFHAPPNIFKMEAQIENLFKRYRFEADLYSDKELTELSISKFQQLQTRLAIHDWKPIKYRAFIVVQEARRIVRRILANHDPNALDEFCRFSSKATVGNAARDAYIDHKFADPMTGSLKHCEWFETHLSNNLPLLFTLLACKDASRLPLTVQCESLQLVPVPKSYKSLRMIMPNTLIGSYYTYGLGKVFVEALKECGLDIRSLQSKHKDLARKSSTTRKLVTADMSAASESFLWSLICRLLPRKWLNAVRLGRLSQYNYDGSDYHYVSFMAMGIGFTFPLQTLLFYALVKATCTLLKVRGLVSVYGDDLIYPYGAHKAVTAVLTDLGMAINLDKTFVDVDFRESCGGDYYRGVDVRPFSPEGECRVFRSRKRYEAWIYQLLNGLQLHWDRETIPKTFAFLESEVLRVAPRVKQVPPSYPDTSGLRTVYPIFSPIHSPVLCRTVLLSPYVGVDNRFCGSREYVFEHLTKVSRQRFVSFEEAYVYDWLRSKANGEESELYDGVYEAASFDSWLKYERFRTKHNNANKWFSDGRPALKLFPLPVQPRNYRSSRGKRIKRCIATSSCKLTPELLKTTRTDSISDWI